MPTPLWGKYCDGGHYCSAPKECCTLGCCYHSPPTDRMFGLLFLLGQWYFWALLTVALLGVLCACSLWRRCRRLFCCFRSDGNERASEPDSTGSCYAPPGYSRCSSFHHAPPPYAEVTSKPDLYPLVISYNGDSGVKRGGSTSYLMVQYFRNYILRPTGSLSATSTIDSLSSSFICNAANEANTIVPPPYSCTGSLEGFNITTNSNVDVQLLHSISSVMCNDYQQPNHYSPEAQATQQTTHNSSSDHNQNRCNTILSSPARSHGQPHKQKTTTYNHNKTTSFVSSMVPLKTSSESDSNEPKPETSVRTRDNYDCCLKKQLLYSQMHKKKNLVSAENSMDSETSQGEDHNFSELLNLSVCAPGNCGTPSNHNDFDTSSNMADIQQSYSIANSVTVSDISSLANLGTPDSPPRATSPTIEIRELLDKIQQLPQHKSPGRDPGEPKPKFFVRNKSKTLYMPLNTNKGAMKMSPSVKSGIFGNTIFNYKTKGWLSRSAPSTPCGNFAPLFPSQRKQGSGSHTGSRSRMPDGSRLLDEQELSDEDRNPTDECL